MYQGNLKHGKATLYFQGRGLIGNVQKVEVREVEVLRRQWAQYPGAVDCRFKAPRQRNWRRYTEGYRPYLVVLDGWGHPDPQGPFDVISDEDGCTVSEARHSFASDGWTTDFDGWLAAYLEATPSATVLGDYRHTTGCNGYDASYKVTFDDQQVESVRAQFEAAGVPGNLAADVATFFVHKSPNWAAGVLCQEGYLCTTGRGRRCAEAVLLNGHVIEPEPFFAEAA
jgi:hypothetical protein